MSGFTDEQLASLAGLLEKREEKLLASLEQKIVTAVTDSRKSPDSSLNRLAEQLQSLENKLGGIESNIPGAVKTSMDELLEQLAEDAVNEAPPPSTSTSASASTSESPDQSGVDAKLQAAIAQMEAKAEAERKKMERRLKQAEDDLAAEKAAKAQLAEENRRNDMQKSVLELLSGRVIPGKERRALQAMLNEGTLVEQDNAYHIKGVDKYGEPTVFALSDRLPTVLEENFSEFLPPRGGTGSGGTASTSTSTQIASSLPEGLTAQDIINMSVNDPAALKELDATLVQALK